MKGSLLNLVGFQTVSSGIAAAGLSHDTRLAEAACFLGVMHRNTFLNAPRCYDRTYQWRQRALLRWQITGVEGHVESAGSGLIAGHAARLAKGQSAQFLPTETMLGALAEYITPANPAYFSP